MLLRGQNLLGYKNYADDVVRKFVETSIKNGIDIIRVFDALNDTRNLATSMTKKIQFMETVLRDGQRKLDRYQECQTSRYVAHHQNIG